MFQQKNTTPKVILFGIVLYIPIIFFLFEYSACASKFTTVTGVFNIASLALNWIVENGICFPTMPDINTVLSSVAPVTLIYFFCVWWVASTLKANEHAFFGNEYGSAKWLTNVVKYSIRFADTEALYAEPGRTVPFMHKFYMFMKKIKLMK